jgi:hypothetical protein
LRTLKVCRHVYCNAPPKTDYLFVDAFNPDDIFYERTDAGLNHAHGPAEDSTGSDDDAWTAPVPVKYTYD